MTKLLMKDLGKTGMKVSAISFGGLVVRKEKLEQEQTDEVLKCAINMGVNFIDTGRAYGKSEEQIGKALKKLRVPRSNVYLASKTSKRDADGARQDVDESLQLLKTDYIDLYQIHYIRKPRELDAVLAEEGGALKGLMECKEEGKIRHIGITGHCNDLLRDALQRSDEFETVMSIFNIAQRDAITCGLIETARNKGVGIIAMKPLCNGFLQPRHALRFLLRYVDTIAVGMGTIIDVVEDIALGSLKACDEERKELEKIADSLKYSGCTRCNNCAEDMEKPLFEVESQSSLNDDTILEYLRPEFENNEISLSDGAFASRKDKDLASEEKDVRWLITDGSLFGIAPSFHSDLDNETISSGLRKEFENNGTPLSGNATTFAVAKGIRWRIIDRDKTYLAMKEDDKLNIYTEGDENKKKIYLVKEREDGLAIYEKDKVQNEEYEVIRTILPLYDYRGKYGLIPEAEEEWRGLLRKAKNIDYERAEKACPQELPIGKMIQEAIIREVII